MWLPWRIYDLRWSSTGWHYLLICGSIQRNRSKGACMSFRSPLFEAIDPVKKGIGPVLRCCWHCAMAELNPGWFIGCLLVGWFMLWCYLFSLRNIMNHGTLFGSSWVCWLLGSKFRRISESFAKGIWTQQNFVWNMERLSWNLKQHCFRLLLWSLDGSLLLYDHWMDLYSPLSWQKSPF